MSGNWGVGKIGNSSFGPLACGGKSVSGEGGGWSRGGGGGEGGGSCPKSKLITSHSTSTIASTIVANARPKTGSKRVPNMPPETVLCVACGRAEHAKQFIRQNKDQH